MKFVLYRDETLEVDLLAISENLNRLFEKSVSFSVGKEMLRISEPFIANPKTYDALGNTLKSEARKGSEVLIVSKKRYDNNFFWDSPPGAPVILSLFAWEDLTTLPYSNGIVYVICSILSGKISLKSDSHAEVTGCINDFLWDKRGIDVGMRSAFVCADCQKKFLKLKFPENTKAIYQSLLNVLNDLSAASRANKDILTFWGFRQSDKAFDVFLCHNTQDKDEIRDLSSKLKIEGVRPWLDEEQIRPGRAWQDVLEANIKSIKTAAVFVGASGLGPWQNVEIRAFLQEFVRRQCPVIPVILPSIKTVPELPLFMQQFMWVDFRKARPDPFGQLLWGIRD